MGGGEIKTLTLRLDDELHRRFKIYAVNEGKSMHELLIEHIQNLLDENPEAE